MRRLVCVLCALGCATGSALRQRAAGVETDIKAARETNAETCAARDLAVAEANLRFAQIELNQGDAFRAEEHLRLAEPAAKNALAKSTDCGKVTVLIREKEAPPAAQPKVALKDTDGDGVPDIDDLCPEVAGPASNHGCPVFADKDGDGVPDDIDRCPDVPGPKENFGCPYADKDGDGVPDNKDMCPDVPGPAENAGCPWADRDKDGVPDKEDECPDEPGPPENKGCPRKMTLVVVKRDRIEIKQQIHFRPAKSVILKDSYELLKQVAQVIKDAPKITVRIEGHTDNVGRLKTNVRVSQARADAVRDFLVKRGVNPKQLVAVGYGPTRPIASNATKAGKALNRRVEFRIVDSTEQK
ncbi:MAG: OmpA family protein [Myxococcales bacterium]|nr:OmpA family protein [Myxococcales bacterium]